MLQLAYTDDENDLAKWQAGQQTLNSEMSATNSVKAEVDGYATVITSAKTTTDFLQSYYSTLQSDTQSIVQWVQSQGVSFL